MLIISQELTAAVREEAERAYPNECCGIIFGRLGAGEKSALGIRPVQNSFEEGEQYHRFRIPAEEMLAAELEARRKGLDIVGFYHSHPDCEAVPSEYDRCMALPIYSYIIASCIGGEVRDLTCWQLDAAAGYSVFAPEKITAL